MNLRPFSFLVGGAVVLSGLSGCGSTCNSRCSYLSTPRPAVTPSCDRCGVGGPQPPRFNPVQPPVVPGPPPPAIVSPPAIPGPTPAAVVAPPAPGDIQQNSYAPAGPTNAAAPPGGAPGVYLSPPEPVNPEATQPPPAAAAPKPDATRLYPPQTAEPPAAPPAKSDRSASPALPVDIPQFAMIKNNVASGQEPYAEGVTWLKTHGYRTVLHLRAPDEDDKAAQALFEKNGLRYLSLQVSPQTLSKEIVEQFNRVLGDADNQPLFVYDKDSSLVGGLWYLHFRLVDRQTDEKARANASQIGFKEEQDGPHRTMWIAVQNYLQNEKP